MAEFVATILCLMLVVGYVESRADCTFTIPSTTDPDSCAHYDLSAVAAKGPFIVSDKKFNYTFGLCQDDFTVPKQCSSKKTGMVAFQYNNDSCYGIGSDASNSTYVVSNLTFTLVLH